MPIEQIQRCICRNIGGGSVQNPFGAAFRGLAYRLNPIVQAPRQGGKEERRRRRTVDAIECSLSEVATGVKQKQPREVIVALQKLLFGRNAAGRPFEPERLLEPRPEKAGGAAHDYAQGQILRL